MSSKYLWGASLVNTITGPSIKQTSEKILSQIEIDLPYIVLDWFKTYIDIGGIPPGPPGPILFGGGPLIP